MIPKYGFPVDVVELDTQRTGTKGGFDVTLTRDLAIAIGEFAPTATLIAAKREWQSCGIKRVPEKEWERKRYKVCPQDNLMVTWNEGEDIPHLACGHPAQERTYIIPKFGFVTGNKPPKVPSRRPTRLFTTRPYFLGATASERGEIQIRGTDELLATVRKAIPGKMAVLCEGRRARQFYVCGSCGAGLIDLSTKHSHTTPWGAECSGTLARASLGHEFITDVVQIEFHLSPTPTEVATDSTGLGLGIATALLEGIAEVVDVPSSDLNVTTGRGGLPGLPVIVMYDDVPGGAGLVARIEDPNTFRMCVEAAHRRVEGGCLCGENTSCYGCLRTYRNQFVHPQLKRGPVKQYLGRILSKWSSCT